jgi:hypothetical protein
MGRSGKVREGQLRRCTMSIEIPEFSSIEKPTKRVKALA